VTRLPMLWTDVDEWRRVTLDPIADEVVIAVASGEQHYIRNAVDTAILQGYRRGVMDERERHDAMCSDCAHHKGGAKRHGQFELWVTYRVNHGVTYREKTYRFRQYATEDVARRVGEQLLRKHPYFYLSYRIDKK
jgi:hypothetical protein